MSIHISSAFDGGNIEVLAAERHDAIRLNIRHDHLSAFYQWFYFRVVTTPDTPLKMHIENAGGAAYPGGWQDYQALISYDLNHWIRTSTDYDKGVLSLSVNSGAGAVYVAYFAPYTDAQHKALVARAGQLPGAQLHVLGQTLDGRDLDLITIDPDPSITKPSVWITARQHPGETMAEWWMDGFIARLSDTQDRPAQALMSKARLYLVTNMNPDGSARGHLRTNAAGINLNREWQSPSMEKSPEVCLTLQKMHETGVDLALDVHGDEALPYNFIAGTEGIPSWTERQAALLATFKRDYVVASNGAFQIEKGYPVNAPGKANLTICANALAETFDCLAMTLEMPFKDDANHPDTTYGWSPQRAMQLGRDCVEPLLNAVTSMQVG